MTRAEERIEDYLYEGESVREAFDVGPFRAVLTTHRVFVAMPEGGTQQADLPDVTGVDRTTRGSTSGLVWGGLVSRHRNHLVRARVRRQHQ